MKDNFPEPEQVYDFMQNSPRGQELCNIQLESMDMATGDLRFVKFNKETDPDLPCYVKISICLLFCMKAPIRESKNLLHNSLLQAKEFYTSEFSHQFPQYLYNEQMCDKVIAYLARHISKTPGLWQQIEHDFKVFTDAQKLDAILEKKQAMGKPVHKI